MKKRSILISVVLSLALLMVSTGTALAAPPTQVTGSGGFTSYMPVPPLKQVGQNVYLVTSVGTGWISVDGINGRVIAELDGRLRMMLPGPQPGFATEIGTVEGSMTIFTGADMIWGHLAGHVNITVGITPENYGSVTGGTLNLNYVIKGGTGAYAGAKGVLKIIGNPLSGTVTGHIK